MNRYIFYRQFYIFKLLCVILLGKGWTAIAKKVKTNLDFYNFKLEKTYSIVLAYFNIISCVNLAVYLSLYLQLPAAINNK